MISGELVMKQASLELGLVLVGEDMNSILFYETSKELNNAYIKLVFLIMHMQKNKLFYNTLLEFKNDIGGQLGLLINLVDFNILI